MDPSFVYLLPLYYTHRFFSTKHLLGGRTIPSLVYQSSEFLKGAETKLDPPPDLVNSLIWKTSSCFGPGFA